MAKRKNTTALFDVISRNRSDRRAFQVPEWMRKRDQQDHSADEQQPSAPVDQHDEQYRAESEPVARPRAAYTGAVRLELSYLTLGVVAAAAVLLLVLTFALGRATGGGGDAVEAGLGAAVAEQFSHEQLQALDAQRRPGHYYLIAQMGVPTLSQAIEAQKFYWLNGVDTTVVPQMAEGEPGAEPVPASFDLVDTQDMKTLRDDYLGADQTGGEERWRTYVENRLYMLEQLSGARAWPLEQRHLPPPSRDIEWHQHPRP